MGKAERASESAGESSSSWTDRPARDLTGQTLGDFLVERLLGQGGMGEVYLARQVSLDRPVALKVLRPDCTTNPTYMARFESEAWAAAKLNHPNIVHIYTLGGLGGARFIAMEYVQGTNLREYLKKKGVPDLPLALAVMRQAGLAVGAAGEAGLIHRDIKPENLLLTRKGQVKVADFGLARLPDSEHQHLTAPGMTLGTPMYMSPEQVQGHELDHRSDLYSLGVTFYHMLAGEPPFRADTAVALALKHVNEEPVPLGKRRPDLPPELLALVMKLMAKSPADRYASAGEMLRDLAHVKEIVQAGTATVADTEAQGRTSAGSRVQAAAIEEDEELEVAGASSWRPGGNLLLAVALPALIVGGVLGWFARAEDLLSASAAPPATMPGLWMADWKLIDRQATAAAQYRHAQVRAPELEREAAWLAVPGRFPKDATWAMEAYIQLGRLYVRRGDGERLAALSREVKESENRPGGTPRAKWTGLATVLHAGEMASKGDAGEVAAIFSSNPNVVTLDPALAELSLEIVTLAQTREHKGGDSERLADLRNQFLNALKLVPALLDRPAFAAP